MPNKSLSRSSLLTYQKYSSLLAGNDPYIPFTSDYDLLETEILPSDQGTVTFSNLDTAYSNDYTHLQFRISPMRPNNGDRASGTIAIQAGQGMAYRHTLRSQAGATPFSAAYANGTFTYAGNSSLKEPSATIIDIYDAFSTNKNPVLKIFGGIAGNTEPYILFDSMYRNNTFAISSIAFTSAANYAAQSRFSLYGIRSVTSG